MCDIDIDITDRRPLRIGVLLRDQVLWDRDAAASRIRGHDLTDISSKSAHLRRAHPNDDVVVDIDVVIAADARTARTMLDSGNGETICDTILYVGTPSGLVSLITDIHALAIVDGAVLIPRTAGVADLIRDSVLPHLHTTLELPAATREARPA